MWEYDWKVPESDLFVCGLLCSPLLVWTQMMEQSTTFWMYNIPIHISININHEASKHSSNWIAFYYARVPRIMDTKWRCCCFYGICLRKLCTNPHPFGKIKFFCVWFSRTAIKSSNILAALILTGEAIVGPKEDFDVPVVSGGSKFVNKRWNSTIQRLLFRWCL